MDSFYLYLPSNARTPSNNNKVSNYITYFKDVIDLRGSWEVGLREIHYPMNWVSIDDINMDLMILDYKQGRDGRRNGKQTNWVANIKITYKTNSIVKNHERHHIKFINRSGGQTVIPQKNYTIDELFTQIQSVYSSISWLKSQIRIFWTGHKVAIVPGVTQSDELVYPLFSKLIAQKLGLNNDIRECLLGEKQLGDTLVGTEDVKGLRDAFRQIYVYSDVAFPVNIGGDKFQLLRVVEVPDKPHGSSVVLRYTDAFYINVLSRQMTSIEIDLRWDDGSTVLFSGGRTLCVLHFRRTNKSNANN